MHIDCIGVPSCIISVHAQRAVAAGALSAAGRGRRAGAAGHRGVGGGAPHLHAAAVALHSASLLARRKHGVPGQLCEEYLRSETYQRCCSVSC